MNRQVSNLMVWYDSLSTERPCKDEECGAKVVWGELVNGGKKMLFDAPAVPLRTKEDEQSGRVIAEMDGTTVHWASCPGSERFRQRQHQDNRGRARDGRTRPRG